MCDIARTPADVMPSAWAELTKGAAFNTSIVNSNTIDRIMA